MRGRFRESEPVEAPPHRAEFWFSSVRVALSPQAGRGTLLPTLPQAQRQPASLLSGFCSLKGPSRATA
jgi:hypothetical protein